jgi:hypothetical protein
MFPITSWCAFEKVHRTNNDCEGWHYRLNRICGANPNLYTLLQELHEESKVVTMHVKLVAAKLLSSQQRHKSRQEELYSLWAQLSDLMLTPESFLDACSTYVAF